MVTTVRDAITRGFNLLAVSIPALAGFAFAPEIFVEADLPDKVDDSLLFLLGLIAIGWYLRGKNRFVQSIVPVVFVVLATVIKIGGLLVEIGDPESMGDDAGGVILFLLATALIIYQYRKSKKLIAEAA